LRISFLIHELGPGGAERVMVHLANGLAVRGHDVTIHTLSAKAGTSFYPLNVQVRQVHLGLNSLPLRKGLLGILAHVIRLVMALRRHLRAAAPEVLISFIDMTNVFALLASTGLPLPVVVSERSDPRMAPLRRVWKVARQLTYPWAAALVVQSTEVRDCFPPWIRRKAKVIPNPVLPPPEIPQGPGLDGTSHTIVAVGRLGPEKGFDLLLQAFARVAPSFQDWDLEIWGEGPDRVSLETLRNRLGLDGRARMPGTTQDIHTRYLEADLFVLASRFEGFPNALCEAMSHGLPAVAASCSGGVRDIVRPGIDGILVPPEDTDALAEALADLMSDPARRASLGEAARQVVDRFSLECVLDDWEVCLQGVRGGRNP
jgi:glycosyltransferase involved in cell wall biosynthesis